MAVWLQDTSPPSHPQGHTLIVSASGCVQARSISCLTLRRGWHCQQESSRQLTFGCSSSCLQSMAQGRRACSDSAACGSSLMHPSHGVGTLFWYNSVKFCDVLLASTASIVHPYHDTAWHSVTCLIGYGAAHQWIWPRGLIGLTAEWDATASALAVQRAEL